MRAIVEGGDWPCPLCRRPCRAALFGSGELGVTHELPACVVFRALEAEEFVHLSVVEHRCPGVESAGDAQYRGRFDALKLLVARGHAVELAGVRNLLGLDDPEPHGARRGN